VIPVLGNAKGGDDMQVYNTELYHFGVKGMKWGHHKTRIKVTRTHNSKEKNEQPKNKILTKRNIAIGTVAVVGALALIGYAKYNISKSSIPLHMKTMNFGSIADLDKMPNKDAILKKGTKFHRVSSKPIEDYTGEGRRIYAAFLKKDIHIYKETIPGFIKSWRSSGIVEQGDGVYEHIMKAKKDIKIPSKRAMADLYMETTGYKEVDEGRYLQFMANLNNRKNPEVSKFFELAKQRGYHAVIDENDAGNFTKAPLILFDLQNTIDADKIKKITKFGRFMNILTM
jgi:hypothetical protein